MGRAQRAWCGSEAGGYLAGRPGRSLAGLTPVVARPSSPYGLVLLVVVVVM
jgi:hypothetical protein